MRKPLSSYLRLIFIIGDLLVLNFAIAVALWFFSPSQYAFAKDFAVLAVPSTLLWLALSFFLNPYKFSRVSPFAKILRVHSSLILVHFLSVISAIFIFNVQRIPVAVLLGMFFTSLALLFFWRVFYFYINRAFVNKNFNFKNVVIVGFGDIALEMRKFFRLHPEHGYRFLGYFDQQGHTHDVQPISSLDEFCKENGVHEIYCCLPHLDNSKVKQLVDFGLSNLIKVKLITDYRGFFQRGISLERYDNIPVFNVAAIPLDDRYNQAMKRGFDIIFSLLLLFNTPSFLLNQPC